MCEPAMIFPDLSVELFMIWLIIGSLITAVAMIPEYGAVLKSTPRGEDRLRTEYLVVMPEQNIPISVVALCYLLLTAAWPATLLSLLHNKH